MKQFARARALIRWRMEPFNERELVERCRAGDEGAFQELVDRYKDLVFALIARTVQERSRAEDLAQDVFLRIHRGLPYFRGEARLSTWIYRIVANVCVQDQTRPVAAVSLDDERARPRVTLSGSDRQFGDLELRDRLEKAIARLPANYRLVDRRALSRRGSVPGSRRGASTAAGDREDTALPREAAAAPVAGDGASMIKAAVRGSTFGVRRSAELRTADESRTRTEASRTRTEASRTRTEAFRTNDHDHVL